MKKKDKLKIIMKLRIRGRRENETQQNSGWLSNAVGVSSRSELLDSTVWSDVFNAVSEGSFVEKGFTTTTTRLLLTTS